MNPVLTVSHGRSDTARHQPTGTIQSSKPKSHDANFVFRRLCCCTARCLRTSRMHRWIWTKEAPNSKWY